MSAATDFDPGTAGTSAGYFHAAGLGCRCHEALAPSLSALLYRRPGNDLVGLPTLDQTHACELWQAATSGRFQRGRAHWVLCAL